MKHQISDIMVNTLLRQIPLIFSHLNIIYTTLLILIFYTTLWYLQIDYNINKILKLKLNKKVP